MIRSLVVAVMILIATNLNADPREKHYFAIRGSQERADSLRIAGKWEHNPAPGASVPLANLQNEPVNKWLLCQAREDRVRQEIKVELAKRADHVRDTVCTHDEVYDWLRRQGLQIKPDEEARQVGK